MSAVRGHRNPQSIIALEKRVNLKQSSFSIRKQVTIECSGFCIGGASNSPAQAVSAGKLYRHRNNRRNSLRIWVLIIRRKPYRHSKTGRHRWALNPLIDDCTWGMSMSNRIRTLVRIGSFGIFRYRCRVSDVSRRFGNLAFIGDRRIENYGRNFHFIIHFYLFDAGYLFHRLAYRNRTKRAIHLVDGEASRYFSCSGGKYAGGKFLHNSRQDGGEKYSFQKFHFCSLYIGMAQ